MHAGRSTSCWRAGLSPALVQLLCTHLIRQPDPVILDQLFDAVYRHPAAADAGQFRRSLRLLYCAAGAGQDWLRLRAAAAELQSIAGSGFTALDSGEAFFHGAQPVPVERCLRALPGLPAEISYAMYDYADLRRAAQKTESPSASATTIAP